MAYGDLKVRNLIWNTGSGDNTVVLSTLATQSYVTTNFAPKSSPTFTGTINGADLILSGNLTVSGTQTIINTNVLQVEDKHIEIGKVSSPSDTTADGGGIILKASSDRTFLWVNATDAWTSSEHIQVASGKTFIGDGSTLTALNATNLASGTVPTARLGTGTAGSANFLRGDGSWQAIATDKIEEGNTSVETVDTGSDGHVKITTEGSEKARVLTNGRVGIGTVAPDNNVEIRTTASGGGVVIKSTGSTSNNLTFDANRSGANHGLYTISGRWNGTTVGTIGCNTGDDTTNKDDGYIWFGTESAASNGNVNATERLRIGSLGQLGVGGATYGSSGQVLTSGGGSAAPSWTTISAAPTITATASGAITANTAVHMNTNGTVQIPTVTARAFGSLTGVQASSDIKKAFWDSSAKIIIVLYTTGSSQPGARVGSVSGTTITWGTAFDLTESSTFDVSYMDIAVDEDGTYVVVMKCSSSPPIRYCMFTVSDLAITMTKSATSVGYESAGQLNVHKTANNVFVTVYKSGSAVKARKGTRSGNSISWDSAVTIVSTQHAFSGETAYSSSAGKILIPYSRSGFWYRLLTVSSMSVGSEQELYIPDPAYQGNTGNWDCIQVGTETVIVWEKDNENAILGVRVATMGSNANSVTWGTAVDVSNNNIEELSGHYNSVTGKVVVMYKYSSNLYYYREITLSGTGNRTATVSAETQITTSTAGNTTRGSVADSVTGADIFNLSINGWSYRILAPEGTTLTADNFVGFASAAYTNGQTATINVIGNTTTQSGLTAASKYYVKKNGTVSTTVDNPSVEAGIALSSTKLLIKG